MLYYILSGLVTVCIAVNMWLVECNDLSKLFVEGVGCVVSATTVCLCIHPHCRFLCWSWKMEKVCVGWSWVERGGGKGDVAEEPQPSQFLSPSGEVTDLPCVAFP